MKDDEQINEDANEQTGSDTAAETIDITETSHAEAAGEGVAGEAVAGEEQAGEEVQAPAVQRDPAENRRVIEAILMVADQPVDPNLLAQLLELPLADIDPICVEMAAGYEAEARGFCLVEVAGGWRFQSHPTQAAYVERFAMDGQVARMSGAALETLAIVAYKQPISRAQIAQIRGVNVDGVMRTLIQRGYVGEIGTDPGPGQATLFGTTTKFLEGMGMGSISDLAPLADFVPGSEIMEALEAGLRVDTEVTLDAGDNPAPVPVPQPTDE
jgi:segregation and condensation protein B